MKKRSRIALLTALLTIVFAAGIGVYSNYIGMQIYQESSNHLLESYAQISKTFTLFVQRNWAVLRQWDSLMKNAKEDADVDSICRMRRATSCRGITATSICSTRARSI